MGLNITKEVANMERLSVGALCERYREVFGEDTSTRNKQWLIKRIAWKLQANEEGDISERARKLAMEIAQSSDIRTSAPKIRTRPIEATFATATTIITPPADSRLPVAGTVLMKNYKGRSIQVRVLPNSFEYEGEQYKTLTSISRIVTGQKNINGFQFFKLGKSEAASSRQQPVSDHSTVQSTLASRPKKDSSKSSILWTHNANPPNVTSRARKQRAGFACLNIMTTAATLVEIWNVRH